MLSFPTEVPIISEDEPIIKFCMYSRAESIYFRILYENPVLRFVSFSFVSSQTDVRIRTGSHPTIADHKTLYLRGEQPEADRYESFYACHDAPGIVSTFIEALFEFSQCFRENKVELGFILGVDDVYEF